MREADKKEFAEIIKASLKMKRIDADSTMLRMFWSALLPYSIEQVRKGLDTYFAGKPQFSLEPGHIIEAIAQNQPDSRPGAEEAWAIYPHDEHSSAVISEEMAEAMHIARPLLEEGDRIGARMAFKEAYTRIVAVNKSNGVAVHWFPSLGTDKEGREEAMRDAVAKGRITQTHAESLLPAPKSVLENMLPELRLLTDNGLTEEQREKARTRMAEIRAKLKGKV
jgi:hypothetical protein